MLMSLSTLPGWTTVILIALGSACACAAILWTLLRTGLAWRLATDIPNDRSLHTRPTPRVGGWGIVPVVVVATLVVAPHLWLAALCAAVLAAVSQIDDRRGLPARVRFAAHLAAVAIFVWAHPAPVPVWLLAALSFLLLWLVNLYNFMDGADGLAGGMTLFGFAGYAVGAALTVHPSPELSVASRRRGGRGRGFSALQLPPGKNLSRRRRVDSARLSGGRFRLLGLERRRLADLVSGAGVLAVHRRRVGDAAAAAAARRENLAGAPRALLSTHGPVRTWAFEDGHPVVCGNGGWYSTCCRVAWLVFGPSMV